ncbi:MAG: hypothetical protein H3C35_09860 [Bacteroidetes bacterium]|nr:hypothetical protein [Bacteroidota bacterium]
MNRIIDIRLCVILMLSMVFLTGCVRFYRTSEVQKNFNEGEKKIQEVAASLETYQNEQHAGYDYLAPQVGKTSKPFPEIFISLQKLDAVVARIKTLQSEFSEVKKKFDALISTFPPGQNIQSNKTGWDEFKPIKEKYITIMDELNDGINEANELQKDLLKIQQKYQIGKTNPTEIKSQITALIASIDQNKAAAGDRLSASDKELIDQKQKEIVMLFDEINTEIGNKSELWSAPGSTVNVKYEAIQKKINEMNGIFAKIK